MPNAQVSAQIAGIERENSMERGSLALYLQSHGVDPETLRQQFRAQFAWILVARRELMPQIRIGDEEINALVAERDVAKKRRDFARADKIRKQLAEQSVIIEDSKEGTRWKRK